jgi:hypothetical protein
LFIINDSKRHRINPDELARLIDACNARRFRVPSAW